MKFHVQLRQPDGSYSTIMQPKDEEEHAKTELRYMRSRFPYESFRIHEVAEDEPVRFATGLTVREAEESIADIRAGCPQICGEDDAYMGAHEATLDFLEGIAKTDADNAFDEDVLNGVYPNLTTASYLQGEF